MARGFSLIEVLVALAVFGIAVLALLNVQGENARTIARLEEKSLARVAAENRLIELMTLVPAPGVGTATGEESLGGRAWFWTSRVLATDDPAMRRIEVSVRGENSDQELALITAFRGAP